jgi:hypothetical protein
VGAEFWRFEPVSCPIGCRNDSVLARTRGPTVRPVSPGVAQAKHQGLSLMAWAGGAVELRSTRKGGLAELVRAPGTISGHYSFSFQPQRHKSVGNDTPSREAAGASPSPPAPTSRGAGAFSPATPSVTMATARAEGRVQLSFLPAAVATLWAMEWAENNNR